MGARPKVALLVETSLGYGRGLLRGIVRYARLHGPWAFYLIPGDLRQALPSMERWGGTGIIARIETRQVEKAILATRLPVVALDLWPRQLAPGSPLAEFSEVRPDSDEAARMAADHLAGIGLRQFAFAGVHGPLWSSRREQGFCRRLAEMGYRCYVYPAPRLKRDCEWSREHGAMQEWLRSLPKPTGLLACDDARGREVLEACSATGIRVPEDVAVVGVDNDELMCDLCDPPLSSVALNVEQGGYEAAALLDRMMSGRVKGRREILVKPTTVVARRSTDVLALSDPKVATALRFIQDNAGRPIGVNEVLRGLRISRRALELRFRRAVGRSLREEIERAHVTRARQLLAETELPIEKVAGASGFASSSYLNKVFRRQNGMTPSQYRSRVRQSP